MTPSFSALVSLIIVLPLTGAVVCGCLNNFRVARWLALFFALAELIVTLLIVDRFDVEQGNRYQMVESYDWIPSLNIRFLVGVDGLSILLLPASAYLTLAAILATWNSVNRMPVLHLSLLMILESATMGVLVSLDLILFFVFWELMLPAIFFLMGLWGVGAERRNAAIKYTLFMMFGGIFLLFGIIVLGLNHAAQTGGSIPQDLEFSLPILLETPLDDTLQTLVFLLLLIGFAVKAPIVPFHTWLPTVAMEGPAHLTAQLTALKLGVFGLIRFVLPLAPSAAVEYSWLLGIVGAITLIYAALIALQQNNLRQLLAYASISHVGLVIVGIASLTRQGIQGAMLQLINFSLVSSSLMLIAGLLHYRLGSTAMIHLGGVAKFMPRLAFLYFVLMLASIGIPLTSGFPAELLMILGALQSHASLGITALAGAALSAAYMLSISRRIFWGTAQSESVSRIQDLKFREMAILAVPVVLIIIFGLWPNGVLKFQTATAEFWLNRLLSLPGLH